MKLYYLADRYDRNRLSTTGDIEPAHDCRPWYFLTEGAALNHPAFNDGLEVKEVPAAETIPGAPLGTDIADAVMADEVYQAIAG